MCVCVCVRERERDGGCVYALCVNLGKSAFPSLCICRVCMCVFLCVCWSAAKASTTSPGLPCWLRPLVQAVSVRRSSWQPTSTKAKHSNTHRPANRELFVVPECVCVFLSVCVLISYWDSCSARDWLQTVLICRLGCVLRTFVCLKKWPGCWEQPLFCNLCLNQSKL